MAGTQSKAVLCLFSLLLTASIRNEKSHFVVMRTEEEIPFLREALLACCVAVAVDSDRDSEKRKSKIKIEDEKPFGQTMKVNE